MTQHFGICEWSLPVSGPLAMQLAHEAGYEGMQLGEAGGRLMAYPLNHPRVQAIYLETAKHLGLTLHSLNLGALLAEGTLAYGPETPQGIQARQSLDHGFAACRALDIHTVVITVEPRDEESFANIVSHLAYATALAQDTQVEISIESAQPLETIQRLLDAVSPEIKVCMDLLNPYRFGTGVPLEQIRAFGRDKISHFHMKDSDKSLFRRGERGCKLLGTGDAKLDASVAQIKEIGFTGWMITENYYYLPPMNVGDDFVRLAMQDLETMKRYFR